MEKFAAKSILLSYTKQIKRESLFCSFSVLKHEVYWLPVLLLRPLSSLLFVVSATLLY